MTKILVIAEIFNGDIIDVGAELTSKAREISNNGIVEVFVAGKCHSFEKLGKAGADIIFVCDDENFDEYSPNVFSSAIVQFINKENPDLVLFGATTKGREIAPLCATALNTGLTADCTGVDFIDENFVATRPTFGGKLYASIKCKTSPVCMSVRPGVFKFTPSEQQDRFVIQKFVPVDLPETYTKVVDFVRKPENMTDISKEKIIFCGGAGAGQKGFELLQSLAFKTGGKVAATRAAVEKNLADKEVQTGQTGKNLSAKIYVGAGVSGAVQHLTGVRACEKIVAINNDPSAPIFENADYGFVGNIFDVLPELSEKL